MNIPEDPANKPWIYRTFNFFLCDLFGGLRATGNHFLTAIF